MRISLTLYVLILTLVVTIGSAHALAPSLSGSALVGMQAYQGESAGVEQNATSFYQQYSVMLTQQGQLYGGRAGAYKLMAGYEINMIAPTSKLNGVRDPEVSDVTTTKPFYNGSLVVAPGGLPFRLTLFAADTKRSTFRDNGKYVSFGTGSQSGESSDSSGHLLTPNLYNDLSNGTQRVVGGVLLIGIRNGSYLGAYRDVLSQLPRLLIDYKQEDVKDLHSSFNQTNYRVRDLAFVSLNKKDNWVHLRMQDFSDFVDPKNNTSTQQVMIGTIDHLLARQWINLTNWIKLSGDLSYTIEKKVEEDEKDIYNVNMLAIAQRQNIAASVFTQFNRQNNGKTITTETTIPVHVSVDFNRDTLLRSRLIYKSEDSSFVEGRLLNDNDLWSMKRGNSEIYLDNQLELERSRPIVVKPRLEIAVNNEENLEDALAVRLGAEVSSNNRLNKAFAWLGGYKLTAVQRKNKSPENSNSDTYLQNDIYGRIDKDLSHTLRVGGNVLLLNGIGAARENSSRIGTMSAGLSRMPSSNKDNSVESDYDGMLTFGSLGLYMDHRYQRISNRLEFEYEFFSSKDISDQRTSLGHSFAFDATKHRIKWNSNLIIGDTPETPRTVDFDYLGATTTVKNYKKSWDSKLNYFYDPTRSVGCKLLGMVTGRDADINYKISEELSYRFFTSNGIVRRIAEFSEEIGYEKTYEALDARGVSLYARLVASFFPTKYLFAKLSSETVFFMDSDALQQFQAGEVGFNFDKLNILASYVKSHKDRESEDLPEVMEQRWEVKVQKLF